MEQLKLQHMQLSHRLAGFETKLGAAATTGWIVVVFIHNFR